MNVEKIEADYAKEATTLPENWKTIRRKIRKRDKNICYICDCWTKKPEIHHRDGDESNNNPDNLVVICTSCHKKLPVAPFSERFYCKTIAHAGCKPLCLRYNIELDDDIENCPYYSEKYGCTLAINDKNK